VLCAATTAASVPSDNSAAFRSKRFAGDLGQQSVPGYSILGRREHQAVIGRASEQAAAGHQRRPEHDMPPGSCSASTDDGR
jgi:hypothetical protein